MTMEPLHPSPGTPQRRSTSRRKDRKSIECYLKSKYPESTFHHLKLADDGEYPSPKKCSKPIAHKSADAKFNIVRSQIPSLVKLSRCIKSRESYLKSKYPDATFPDLKVVESSDGECSHGSRMVNADKSEDEGEQNKACRCSSHVEDSPGDSKNPAFGIKQSFEHVILRKTRRVRPRKKNNSKSPTPTIFTSLLSNGCANNGKQSSERGVGSANLSASSFQKITLPDNYGSISDKSLFRIPPVVKISRLKDELHHALEEHGFISASWVTMEMGHTPRLIPSSILTKRSGVVPFVGKNELENTPTKLLKSDSPPQDLRTEMLNQYDSSDETESTPFLGFSSPEREPSYTKYSLKHNRVVVDDKRSRGKGNLSSNKEFSMSEDLDLEHTVVARCNGSKKSEAESNDFCMDKQFLKCKIVDDSRSSSKIWPFIAPQKRSVTRSRKMYSKTGVLNRSKYSSMKGKTNLIVAKSPRKVDDVENILASDEEQVGTNEIMMVQPIVMQQIRMPRIVIPPLVMHNYTYQLPSQGHQLVSGQLMPRNHNLPAILPPFASDGVIAPRSDNDDIISIASSSKHLESSDSDNELINLAHDSSNTDGSFSDSGESENEMMVRSLIEEEIRRAQFIPPNTKDPPIVELGEYCYISGDMECPVTSRESESAKMSDEGLTEPYESIEKLEGKKEEQREPCASELLVDTSLLYEERVDSCDSLVVHNEVPIQEEEINKRVPPVKSTEHLDNILSKPPETIDKLEGAKDNHHQPYSSELSVEKSVLDEENTKSCSKSPVIISDMPIQEENGFCPFVRVTSAQSAEHDTIPYYTESVEKPQLDEESKESSGGFPVIGDIPNRESSFSPVACHSKFPTENLHTAGLTKSADSAEKLEAIKEDQHMSCSTESVEKQQNYEEIVEYSCESPVGHNGIPNQETSVSRSELPTKHFATVEFIQFADSIEKLEGTKKDRPQLGPSGFSVLEEESAESCSESPLIHNDFPLQEENGFHQIVDLLVSQVDSAKHLDTTAHTESAEGIQELKGKEEDQLQPSTPNHDEALNQNNNFSPIISQSIPSSESAEYEYNTLPMETNENKATIEGIVAHPPIPFELSIEKSLLGEEGAESFSRLSFIANDIPTLDNGLVEQSLADECSEVLGDTIKCSLQSPSIPDVSSGNSHECFKKSSSDHHDSTFEGNDGVNRSIPTLIYTGNVEDQEKLGECSVSEISSCEPLDDSSYHDTMEVDIPSNTLENLVEECPLDKQTWDNRNKLPLKRDEPDLPDFMQVETQFQVEPVENMVTISGVVSHETDTANVMSLDTSAEPLPQLPLGETIQGAILPETTYLIISSDSTEEPFTSPPEPLCKTEEESVNEITTDDCRISFAESSSNELCALSSKQELDGIKCSLGEQFIPETCVPHSLCESIGKPSMNSGLPPSSGSACVKTITPNGLSYAHTSRMQLASFLETGNIPELVNDYVSPANPDKMGALIDAYDCSSVPVLTECGDNLEKTGQIEEHSSCSKNIELEDQPKIPKVESTKDSNLNGQLDKKCSQENVPSDFLEMSDYTEAMVDACLRENLPGSYGDCLSSLQVVESADFPSVSATSEVLRDTVRESGRIGATAHSPVELDYKSQSPQELIFDGYFSETDELKIEGHSNNGERDTVVDTRGEILDSTHLEDVNLTLGLSQSSSTIEIRKVGISQKVSLVQPSPDVSVTVILETKEGDEHSKKLGIFGRKEPANNISQICSKVNDLLFDEEFEQNENATPLKRSRIVKRMLQDSPIPVRSKPSELLFDEEFETSNQHTPLSEFSVEPSITISRVHSKRPSGLLFDEEFEQSNNASPVKKQKCGNMVRASSPQVDRITSLGIVNKLEIDDNDERPVSRSSSLGCVVISSDDECDTPLNNFSVLTDSDFAKPVNRPTLCLQDETKTDVLERQNGRKSKSKPMATISPRVVGTTKDSLLKQVTFLCPVFKENCFSDLSDTIREPANSPPRKICKLFPCEEETPDPQRRKENHSEQSSVKGAANKSELPEKSVETSPIIPKSAGNSRNSLLRSTKKLNSTSKGTTTRCPVDVIELTDSDTEADKVPTLSNSRRYSSVNRSTEVLNQSVKGNKSLKAKNNKVIRPLSTCKPKVLSVEGRKFIKCYSKQLVELVEKLDKPCRSFSRQFLSSTQKDATATFQKNAKVSEKESQVIEPSSYKPSTNSTFHVVSSKNCGSTNRFTSLLSKSILPSKPSISSIVLQNITLPRSRGVSLDDQINCGPGLSVSRLAASEALPSKPVLSKQFEGFVKKPGTTKRSAARAATPAEKLPSSVSRGLSSRSLPPRVVKTNQPSPRRGSPLQSQTGSRNRPTVPDSTKLKQNVARITRPVLKIVSTSSSLEKNSLRPVCGLSELKDDSDEELSSDYDDDSSPEITPPKLVLSRQSLKFINTVTQKSKRPGNLTPANVSTKNPPSAICGRISRHPQKT